MKTFLMTIVLCLFTSIAIAETAQEAAQNAWDAQRANNPAVNYDDYEASFSWTHGSRANGIDWLTIDCLVFAPLNEFNFIAPWKIECYVHGGNQTLGGSLVGTETGDGFIGWSFARFGVHSGASFPISTNGGYFVEFKYFRQDASGGWEWVAWKSCEILVEDVTP